MQALVWGGPGKIEFTNPGVHILSRGVGSFGRCSNQFLPLWWGGRQAQEITAPHPSPGPILEGTVVRRLDASTILVHQS